MENKELNEMIQELEILKDKLAEGIKRLEEKVDLVANMYRRGEE